MKRLILLLVLTANLSFSQKNISLIQSDDFTFKTDAEDNFLMAITSFELINGVPIVKAEVDGIKGDFIIDTGSPGIVLNSSLGKKGKEIEASGIGGPVQIEEVTLSNFQWGMIEKSNLTGFSLDISHLEKACDRKLMGLIGFEVLKNYELLFDYESRLIRVFKAENAHKYRPKKALVELPIRLNGHVPIVVMKVGNKRAYLGLDSGAEANILDAGYLKKVKSKDAGKERVAGLNKKVQLVQARKLDVKAGEDFQNEDTRFLFIDLGPVREQTEVRIDGILGFPFFENNTVSINYKTKKMYIWR